MLQGLGTASGTASLGLGTVLQGLGTAPLGLRTALLGVVFGIELGSALVCSSPLLLSIHRGYFSFTFIRLKWVYPFTGLDYWTGLLDWITGLDYWTGLLDWTTGLT